jgi:hypothetical protein
VLLLLGALLILPPLFVLGPLAGLLAASRPRSVREWCWIGAALLWTGLTLVQPGGLAAQTVIAWALCVTGAVVLLMVATNASVVTGALAATALSFVLTSLWLWHLQIEWREVQFAVERAAQDAWREQVASGGTLFEDRQDVQQAMRVMITALSGVLPAVLTLTILPALAIAWSWYRRLAGSPIGAPAQRFAEFRFSDQLIWGVVLGAVALVAPLTEPFDTIASNLAVLFFALYLARGAAVMWSRVERLPAPLLVLLAMLAMVFMPVMLGAAFALGLADTWVDFRRRAALMDQTRE